MNHTDYINYFLHRIDRWYYFNSLGPCTAIHGTNCPMYKAKYNLYLDMLEKYESAKDLPGQVELDNVLIGAREIITEAKELFQV